MEIDEPIIRLTRPTDINALSSLDLKTYHYPFPLEKWKELVRQSGKPTEARVVVAEAYRRPIGFAMWQEEDDNLVRIIRIGVLPKHRRIGIGTLLIHKCVSHSMIDQKEHVVIVVPDIHCSPGDPDDVSAFLKSVKFTTTGKIVSEYCRMYGEWRDGYVFERNILNDPISLPRQNLDSWR